jgi:hypothetical protein
MGILTYKTFLLDVLFKKSRVFFQKTPTRAGFIGFYWVFLGFIGVFNFRPKNFILLPIFGLFTNLIPDN